MTRSPYDVLGIAKGASQDEIKSAFRKKAKEYHPDLHPGDLQAEEKFKEVNTAYEMLMNPGKYAAEWAEAEGRTSRPGYGSGPTGSSFYWNPYNGQQSGQQSGGSYGQNSGSYGSGPYGQNGNPFGQGSGPYSQNGSRGSFRWTPFGFVYTYSPDDRQPEAENRRSPYRPSGAGRIGRILAGWLVFRFLFRLLFGFRFFL